jgi:hypothetical protein
MARENERSDQGIDPENADDYCPRGGWDCEGCGYCTASSD